MTGLEFDNFQALDRRKYILEENQEFLEWYYMKEKQGFSSIINIKQMQDLINQVTMFYEIKYPDEMFDSIRYNTKIEACKNAKKISHMLGLEQLKFRLYHDYVQFLECNYCNHITLKRTEKKFWELGSILIRINPNGEIQDQYLNDLKEYNFLDDIDGINKIEDLYGKFESIETDVDYSELKKWIHTHKYNVSLRNKVLKLIPLAMLYSKTTLPDYGYIRAKSFIRTFNQEYKLKMNLEELEEIISVDYSNTEEVTRLIKKKD